MQIQIWTATNHAQIKSADLIPEEEFAALHEMLSKIKVRILTTGPRGDFGRHRSMTFGLTRHRFKGRALLPSWASLKYPRMHEEVFRLGRAFCPHPFTSVHLNNNVICPPHTDGNNNGESTVLSFGEYRGCNLVIEGIECDARHRPITFDGNVLKHWNTPNLDGNKYSLVFFNMYD